MSSPIERISPQELASDKQLVKDLVQRLSRGEVLAMPTETVFGLTARADSPVALERIANLKGRPDSMPLTWHVAPSKVANSLAAFGESHPLAGVAQRLASCYWPGPLTMILDGEPAGLDAVASDGSVGIRCPAHELTSAVLEAADFPIVMTSANLHGQDPALNADQVAAAFAGHEHAQDLALIVDAGASQTGGASSLLRLGGGKFELLREGLLSLADLRGAAGLSIGFTCTGNTCRSPLAEGIARRLVASALAGGPRECAGAARTKVISNPADFGFAFSSMGVAAQPGSPVSEGSLVVAKDYGVNLAGHSASPATLEAIEELDVIYGLTHSHVTSLTRALPTELQSRVQLLDPSGYDISDPIGGPIKVYRDTAQQIAACIEKRLSEWI
ncbi:MAG: L-threonylcarbamoyladenylate synthase [Planctomycetota bacterium]|jgi:L-threonylcarbamoyladenylate synthase